MRTRKIVALAFVMAIAAGSAYAGDSPQFRGPNRDGNFDEKGLLKVWPENGPPVAWVASGLGKGFSSASVAQGKVYVTGMQEDQVGYVFVLNADGTIEKRIACGPETVEKQAPGTRSTPTIDGDRLYVISGLGVLYCIDLTKGEKQWEVNVLERFGGRRASGTSRSRCWSTATALSARQAARTRRSLRWTN